ncbi:hypothetical protein niasHS_012654 [Heterodera schachtii]|uniref:DUF7083 domain-containing protein n=1 Tax=Heterodera schachtii TaxID=97005 RepID=A0ABD2ISZ6_HETSC
MSKENGGGQSLSLRLALTQQFNDDEAERYGGRSQRCYNRSELGENGEMPNPQKDNGKVAICNHPVLPEREGGAGPREVKIRKLPSLNLSRGIGIRAYIRRLAQALWADHRPGPHALSDQSKVQLLIGKLGEAEHKRYIDSIAPKSQNDFNWDETTAKLKHLFGETRSLFLRRFDCFQIRQDAHQDGQGLIALINSSCENADLSLSKEELKCMILIIALRDEFTDLRQKCLQRLEDSRTSGRSTSLQELGEECRKYQILKESALSLSSNPCSTSAIRAKPQQIREKQKSKMKPQQSQKGQNFQPKNSTAIKGKVDRRDQPCSMQKRH